MGRSVNYLDNASRVTYFPFEGGKVPILDEDGNETDEFEYDEDLQRDDWDEMKEDIVSTLTKAFPSLAEPDAKRWDNNETVILLENNLVELGLSEYCGLCSLSVRPKYDDYQDVSALAENWISLIWNKLERILSEQAGLQVLYKVASASNGEAFYQEKAAAA